MPNYSAVVTLHDCRGQTTVLRRTIDLPFHPYRGLKLRLYGASGVPRDSRICRVLYRTDTGECLLEMEDRASKSLELEAMIAEMGDDWQPGEAIKFRRLGATA